MQQHADVVTDLKGNVVRGAQVRVLLLDGSLATIYAANGGAPTVNPLTTGQKGEFAFYAPNGDYQLEITIGGKVQGTIGPVKLYDVLDDGDAARWSSLGADDGAEKVGNGGESVAAALNALQFADYAALRAYAGPRQSVYVTGYLVTAAPSGIAGMFVRDDHDTTTADNGGTVIVANNGVRWKRVEKLHSSWFGIAPNTGVAIPSATMSAYFAACNALNSRAVFGSGQYIVSGSGYQLPDYGIEGQGRNETVFLVDDAATGTVFTLGQLNQWTKIKGNVARLRIQANRACAANLLNINTPTRGVQVSDVSFLVGSGACVTLTNSFYVHFQNVVFEGAFNANLATSTSDMLVGTAVLGTDKEVNNITFTKPDARYLSQFMKLPTTPFQGSNCIKITGGAIEYIGDVVFNTPGARVDCDNVYLELLDRNQAVAGPNASTTVLMTNGGANCLLRNCLVNLTGVRATAKLLTHTLGNVTFDGGSVTGKPAGFTIIDPITYTQRGTVVNRGCIGLGNVPQPAWAHFEQQRAKVYPFREKEPFYGPIMGEETYALNTLHFQSWPTAKLFSFQNIQPIVSVEGQTDTSTTMVDVDVTLYRYLPDAGTVGWKRLAIRFLVKPDMAASIVPTVTVLDSGGDQAGFSDAAILTKIVANRRTTARADMTVPYTWHYQLCIQGESGGATGRILANQGKATMIWLDGGARDTTHPAYSIYDQSAFYGAP